MKTNSSQVRIFNSDAAAIMGYDKYKSPFQVWMEKTGKQEENADSPGLKFDRVIKNTISEYFEEDEKVKLASSNYIQHDKYDFICSTPHKTYSNNGQEAALELGYSKQYFDRTHSKFMFYYCKLQLFLGLSGIETGQLFILNLVEREFYKYEYNFDPDFFDAIIENIVKFWDEYIIKDAVPPPSNIMDIKNFYKGHVSGKLLEAGKPEIDAIKELKSVKEEIKNLEKQADLISKNLMEFIKDAEGLTDSGKILCTWKSTNEFDIDLFRSENPGLYKEFQTELNTKDLKKRHPKIYENYKKFGSRRFSVK